MCKISHLFCALAKLTKNMGFNNIPISLIWWVPVYHKQVWIYFNLNKFTELNVCVFVPGGGIKCGLTLTCPSNSRCVVTSDVPSCECVSGYRKTVNGFCVEGSDIGQSVIDSHLLAFWFTFNSLLIHTYEHFESYLWAFRFTNILIQNY